MPGVIRSLKISSQINDKIDNTADQYVITAFFKTQLNMFVEFVCDTSTNIARLLFHLKREDEGLSLAIFL